MDHATPRRGSTAGTPGERIRPPRQCTGTYGGELHGVFSFQIEYCEETLYLGWVDAQSGSGRGMYAFGPRGSPLSVDTSRSAGVSDSEIP